MRRTLPTENERASTGSVAPGGHYLAALRCFANQNRSEQEYLLWQVLSTHAARYIGAGLQVLGSEGEQTLKEIALGHVSDNAYGYGPRLLEA